MKKKANKFHSHSDWIAYGNPLTSLFRNASLIFLGIFFFVSMFYQLLSFTIFMLCILLFMYSGVIITPREVMGKKPHKKDNFFVGGADIR